MELYVILWLLQKIVTEMATYHWFKIFEINNDKLHIRNIHIKCTIIIIFQYTKSEYVPLVDQYHINYLKSISITHPINFDLRITNIPMCIVYEHLIWLPITRRFLMWGLLALNRLNNNRCILKFRSSIKIQSTPRLGLGKIITLTGYSSVLTLFTWSRLVYNCITIYPTTIVWPLILLVCLVFSDYI